jgi:hypothetical protein
MKRMKRMKFPIPIRISSGQGLYDAISVEPKTK